MFKFFHICSMCKWALLKHGFVNTSRSSLYFVVLAQVANITLINFDFAYPHPRVLDNCAYYVVFLCYPAVKIECSYTTDSMRSGPKLECKKWICRNPIILTKEKE